MQEHYEKKGLRRFFGGARRRGSRASPRPFADNPRTTARGNAGAYAARPPTRCALWRASRFANCRIGLIGHIRLMRYWSHDTGVCQRGPVTGACHGNSLRQTQYSQYSQYSQLPRPPFFAPPSCFALRRDKPDRGCGTKPQARRREGAY